VSFQKSDNNDERLEILLALALDETLLSQGDVEGCSAGQCLDEEEFAAWHEGNLPKTRQQEILNHLGLCPKCYELWVELGGLSGDPEF
jgi:hypothetical protein